MNDRAVIVVAGIPMLTGALLLVALQRLPPAPRRASAEARGPVHATLRAGPEPCWLGVVVAGHTAELASDLDGKVTDVWIKAGARVKKGDPILQIDSREATHAEALVDAELQQRRSELARAKARSEEAKTRLARLQEGQAWISGQELDSARAGARVAEADLRNARAGVQVGQSRLAEQRLRTGRHRFEAPFDGVLVSCDVDPGDQVVHGQIVARVITDDRQVRFALPREQLAGEALDEVLLTLSGGEQLAKVTSLQPEVDPAAQMVFATAAVSTVEAALMPGVRVQVRPIAPLPQDTPEGK